MIETQLLYIPSEDYEKVKSWFKTRGGVLVWTNQEIGNSRPELYTPKTDEHGNPYPCPHWAYKGNAREVRPEELHVRKETKVEMPLDWFPVCEHCKGSGRRALADLAAIRGVPIEVLLHDKNTHLEGVNEQDYTFNCSWCHGTGHVERFLSVSIRRNYWGTDISATGKKRADKYARRLEKQLGLAKVFWTWEYIGYGKADLHFYMEEIHPFIL